MAGETILVTGASGFTGGHFIPAAIARGFRCVALCHHEREHVPAAEACFTADICDRQAVVDAVAAAAPDIVVHLSAISFVAHDNSSEIYRVNLLGTLNLLDAVAALSTPVQRILLASSANIYGRAEQLPITEDCPPQPVNHYAASKLAMEQAALQYRDLPVVMTRPFNYTGRGQDEKFLVPKIVAAFRRGERSIALGNLDVARDFTDVRDLVSAYLGLLQASPGESVYNVCSGTATSLMEIVEHLNEIAGYRMAVETHADFVRADEIKVSYGSDQRLRAAIGDYRRHHLRQTLEWMYGE